MADAHTERCMGAAGSRREQHRCRWSAVCRAVRGATAEARQRRRALQREVYAAPSNLNSSVRACVQPFFLRNARLRVPLRPAPGASEDGAAHQPSLHLPSTCPPLSPRVLTRARYGGAALGLLSSGQLVPAQHGSMARSARACCAGAAAKAPTQRAARRNRRRMWCLGLRLDAHGGGGGGGGGDGSHHLCSTPSSCDGVECVFAFPTGEARHRARRCTQVRCRRRLQRRPDGDGSKRKRQRIARRCGTASENNRGRRRWCDCLHAPRPAI
jgi:hypothetical protein